MVLLYWGADSLWALAAIGLIVSLAVILGIQAHRMRVLGGNEELVGMHGEVTQASDGRGKAYALVRGEIWRVHSREPLAEGDDVRVRAARGLTLEVERPAERAGRAPDQPSTTQGGES
ncbi:NfeD family protein [Castellaniella sp. GW247-6E4]|uniref:NfeD family protein n=1 Tax=Castellaniella sp. GW247-6E4 TaxID=3140380 RepID=UPI003314657D